MVAINFQKQFAGDVESGKKARTIRAKARAKVGDKLQLYTGMRTKGCRKLRDAICTEILPIEILDSHFYIQYEHCLRAYNTQDEKDAFAECDGFKSYDDMYDFFCSQHGEDKFKGFIIKWKLV